MAKGSKKRIIDKLLPNTYGNYIIYLQGFWIIENDIYFQWYVLQAKIDLPLFLEEYSFDASSFCKAFPVYIQRCPENICHKSESQYQMPCQTVMTHMGIIH